MSSWYVWNAIGLYPNAGQDFYYVGSPIFTRSVIELGRGRRFEIEAANTSADNRYVQAAALNGVPLERAWLHPAEVARGGKLVLTMGPQPSPWGRSALPPSVSLQP